MTDYHLNDHVRVISASPAPIGNSNQDTMPVGATGVLCGVAVSGRWQIAPDDDTLGRVRFAYESDFVLSDPPPPHIVKLLRDILRQNVLSRDLRERILAELPTRQVTITRSVTVEIAGDIDPNNIVVHTSTGGEWAIDPGQRRIVSETDWHVQP